MRLLNILKTENIIKLSPDINLSKALSKLTTSHDAAFIFDEDKFLGVINPYHCVIKNSYPGNTKVSSCLFHPPKIYLNYPLIKVCHLFIHSKVHYLPVFNLDEKFLGIISVRRLLSYFKNLPIFKIKIGDFLKRHWKPLITINQESSINEALTLFKTKKISKLVVVDFQGNLKGILSYYDLIDFIIAPKEKEKKGDRIGTKGSFYNFHVKKFMKNYVLTMNKDKYLTDVIEVILNKKIGSVVIVDNNKKPTNIITSQDILKFYIEKNQNDFFKLVSSKIGQLLLKKDT